MKKDSRSSSETASAKSSKKPDIYLNLISDSDTEDSLVAATTPSQPVFIADTDSEEKVFSLFFALTHSEKKALFYHILNHNFTTLY